MKLTLCRFIHAVIFFRLVISQPAACRNPAPHWHHLTGPKIKDIRLAILPVGSTESHGPHLPLGTDLLIAEALVKHATDGLSKLAVLRGTSYGASLEHGNLLGTVSLNDDTLQKLWDDILASVVKSGVEKLLLVNAHGGQTPNAQIAIRRARFRYEVLAVLFDAQASLAEAFTAYKSADQEVHKALEGLYGIHGGLIETSVLMHLFPNLVEEWQMQSFDPLWKAGSPLEPYGRVVSYGWRSEDICREGAVGNAAVATAKIGKHLFEQSVEELRKLIRNVLEVDVASVLHLSEW